MQILSDIGLFGAITIFLIFIYFLLTNLKILFNKNQSNFLKSYFILNLGIMINLMPFIPSGSFLIIGLI